jgi:hypothetical protein
MRIDGQALGIALSGAVVAVRLPVHLAALAGQVGPANAQAEALMLAIHDAFGLAAIVCGIGIVTSLLGGTSGPGPPTPAAGVRGT